MRCEEVYFETYGRSPEAIAFCPYRISPLGAHLDHQWGKINGLAIDKGIHIAYTESNEARLGAVKDIQLAARGIIDDCVVMAGDNVLDFSLQQFVWFAIEKGTSCVMCHEENRLEALQKTAVITMDENNLITSYEEKPNLREITLFHHSISIASPISTEFRKLWTLGAETMRQGALQRG